MGGLRSYRSRFTAALRIPLRPARSATTARTLTLVACLSCLSVAPRGNVESIKSPRLSRAASLMGNVLTPGVMRELCGCDCTRGVCASAPAAVAAQHLRESASVSLPLSLALTHSLTHSDVSFGRGSGPRIIETITITM